MDQARTSLVDLFHVCFQDETTLDDLWKNVVNLFARQKKKKYISPGEVQQKKKSPNLIEMENEIQLADILECAVQRFYENLNK